MGTRNMGFKEALPGVLPGFAPSPLHYRCHYPTALPPSFSRPDLLTPEHRLQDRQPPSRNRTTRRTLAPLDERSHHSTQTRHHGRQPRRDATRDHPTGENHVRNLKACTLSPPLTRFRSRAIRHETRKWLCGFGLRPLPQHELAPIFWYLGHNPVGNTPQKIKDLNGTRLSLSSR
jgi:hypothetical protein